jgi:hypothetical protein
VVVASVAVPRRSHSDIYMEECHVPGCIFLLLVQHLILTF